MDDAAHEHVPYGKLYSVLTFCESTPETEKIAQILTQLSGDTCLKGLRSGQTSNLMLFGGRMRGEKL